MIMWNKYREELDSIHLDEHVKERILNREIKKSVPTRMIVGAIALVLLIVGISVQTGNKQSNVGYLTSTYINEEMKQALPLESLQTTNEMEQSSIDKQQLDFDYLVLATIISNDEATKKIGHKTASRGYTRSTILIQETYKGKNLNNTVQQVYKEGGIFLAKEMIQGQQDGYVNTTAKDDLLLEEGKTYVLCLKQNDDETCFEVMGRKEGIKETNIPKTKVVKKEDYSDITVKNHKTNDDEPVTSLIYQLLNEKGE